MAPLEINPLPGASVVLDSASPSPAKRMLLLESVGLGRSRLRALVVSTEPEAPSWRFRTWML